MKKTTRKIISLMLMLSLLITITALALPTSIGYAADSDISATASPSVQSGTPGSKLTFAITIANAGTDTFDLTPTVTSQPRGWTTPNLVFFPSTVNVGSNGSATIIVEVIIPSTLVAGDTEVVTVTLNKTAGGYITSVPLTVNVIDPNAGAKRPQLGVYSSTFGGKPVKAGSEFELTLVVDNRGQVSAYNNTVTFSGEGFYPTSYGGMQSIQNIEPGGKITFYQKFRVGEDMAWTDIGSISVAMAYMDSAGKQYTDTLTVSVPLTSPYTGPAATATPKSTIKPQLVIVSNSTDIDPLQPGSIFELTLDVRNLGSVDAKSVIMVLGGGATTVNDLGTPQPGTGGSGADLTNFAPLGSSNIIMVGDIAKGASVSLKQKLVVNVTTVPGAYTLKTSFSYVDGNGTRFVDDQVITLLVYSLPQVEVNFYQDPGMLMAETPNMLPLQVTNLGKKSSVLGNMKVTSPNAEVTNNVALVGALDPGGYFTLDSQIIPMQEGPLEIEVTINYTDDFNQPREIKQTLSLDVMPAPVFTPEPLPGDELPVDTATDTFWGKVLRFFKGLIGLDSGVKEEPVMPAGGEEMPAGGSSPVIVVPKG